jgi:hypothetical protein
VKKSKRNENLAKKVKKSEKNEKNPGGTKVGQNWYQSNRKDKLYCRQMSFSMPQGTPSREYHKRNWWL